MQAVKQCFIDGLSSRDCGKMWGMFVVQGIYYGFYFDKPNIVAASAVSVVGLKVGLAELVGSTAVGLN